MFPHSIRNGVPVFLKSDCDVYGLPFHHGYDDYLVVDDVVEYVMDYKMGLERHLRPIHRYDRKERFIFILAQLLGLRGDVSTATVRMCKGCKSWEDVRKVLKREGKSKMYNRIPYIMKCLGLPPKIILKVDNELFRQMVDDFVLVQNKFKFLENRKYFPSLRFIAVKIIESYGGIVDFNFIRTKRKLKELDADWLIMQ